VTDLMYSGITGGILETSDISRELGISYGDAMAIQEERAERRAQEYRDAIADAESNVIQFRPRGK
jgi:hypothetical protein